jgi:hypothetical protein
MLDALDFPVIAIKSLRCRVTARPAEEHDAHLLKARRRWAWNHCWRQDRHMDDFRGADLEIWRGPLINQIELERTSPLALLGVGAGCKN